MCKNNGAGKQGPPGTKGTSMIPMTSPFADAVNSGRVYATGKNANEALSMGCNLYLEVSYMYIALV